MVSNLKVSEDQFFFSTEMLQLLSSGASNWRIPIASMCVGGENTVASHTPPYQSCPFITALQTAEEPSRLNRDRGLQHSQTCMDSQPPPLPQKSRDNGGGTTSLSKARNFRVGIKKENEAQEPSI